jgi:hypothetical protein
MAAEAAYQEIVERGGRVLKVSELLVRAAR